MKPNRLASFVIARHCNDEGNFHRLGGPAVEWSDGHKEWWIDGKLHRLDGPAMESYDSPIVYRLERWCINGAQLSKEEFDQHPLVIFWRLVQSNAESAAGANGADGKGDTT